MTDLGFVHTPVLCAEVVELFRAVPSGVVVDCTVGGGGHAEAILRSRSDLTLLGIDRDAVAITAAAARLAPFKSRATLVQGEFDQLNEIVVRHCGGVRDDVRDLGNDTLERGEGAARREGVIVGFLFDLGVSSPQLDRPERGFSFRFDAPLDMRMDSRQSLTAADVVNSYDEANLATIIAENGEEKFARRIAARIVAARPVTTTFELVECIKRAIPAPARRKGGHPAKRTFQALRMEVNRELPSLEHGLDESVHLVSDRGRVLVLAYHSLEDRIVKERFAEWAGARPAVHLPRFPVEVIGAPASVRLLTRKPIRPQAAELAANPRSESVRLRAVERIMG